MQSAPRIGVPGRLPSALLPYRQGIELAGGRVVVLDQVVTPAELRSVYETLDGLLLPGGAGGAWLRQVLSRLDPLAPRLWEDLASYDLTLARWALVDGLPCLGICRGMQMMALAAQGRLADNVLGHQRNGVFPAHEVRVEPGSLLGEVIGRSCLPVNSRHRRAVESLPEDSRLAPVGWSVHDGVVEGIASRSGTFALGVQFHPESLLDSDEPSRALFHGFVAACAGRR